MSSRTIFILVLTAAVLVLAGCAPADALPKDQPSAIIPVEDIKWMEISPLMSNTTYVDDAASIEKVADLLNTADLTPVSATQAEQTGPNPADYSCGDATYPRNIRLDFTGKEDADICTILFYGDYIKINDHYYTASSPLTNEFISILDAIHQQGLGKSAQDIME